MRDLIRQEQFEIEVLDRLQSRKLLGRLIFVGGTMLRLCYGLERYSVDLDFWMEPGLNLKKLFNDLKKYLDEVYVLKDAASKFSSLVFEIRSRDYPRSLKIEIRKEPKKIATETAIAFSPHADRQVLIKTPTLEEVLQSKIAAFLNRGEIRDVFDMEFLIRRGIDLKITAGRAAEIIKKIEKLKKQDYSVKLGSLLEEKQRKHYLKENFKFLTGRLQAASLG
jgi:predicted nucleotidyltransferase component of viral defense system